MLAATGEIADGTRDLETTVAALNELLVPDDRRHLHRRCGQRRRDQAPGGARRRPARRRDRGRVRRPRPAAARRSAASRAAVSRRARRRRAAARPRRRRARARAPARGADLLRDLRAAARPRAPARRADPARHRPLARARYDREDLEFAKVLAGRAALALDNAGLFAELETIEAQLTAVLSTLAEAVTVQHTERRARLRQRGGRADARLRIGAGAAQHAGRPDRQRLRLDEGGRLAGAARGSARAPAARGRPQARPLVVRAVDKRTGSVDWRVTKASGVYGSDGELKLVVNVIEDITEVKRAELAQRMLARAGELLASSLDYERTLQQVAELAVPELARLVHGEPARRPRLHPRRRRRARRPREGRARAPHRRALPVAHRRTDGGGADAARRPVAARQRHPAGDARGRRPGRRASRAADRGRPAGRARPFR